MPTSDLGVERGREEPRGKYAGRDGALVGPSSRRQKRNSPQAVKCEVHAFTRMSTTSTHCT